MDYFSAGPLIQAKLKAQLAADEVTARVLMMAGWEQVLLSLQSAPFFGVWHQTDRVPAESGGNRGSNPAQLIDQVWAVVAVVRNVGDIAGAGAQVAADPLIQSLLKLKSVKLSPGHGHLQRVQSQYMTGYRQGCGIYPFAFSTRIAT